MDSLRDSTAFLRHFDYEREGSAPDIVRSTPRRGVGWILRWAAAIVVFWFASSVLVQFAYSLAAEHTLTRAARSAALEAAMPRATYGTVRATVERRFTGRLEWIKQLSLTVRKNGAAASGAFRSVGGDCMAVTLTLPCRAVVPRWISALCLWTIDSRIEVRAEREVPGRAVNQRGRRL